MLPLSLIIFFIKIQNTLRLSLRNIFIKVQNPIPLSLGIIFTKICELLNFFKDLQISCKLSSSALMLHIFSNKSHFFENLHINLAFSTASSKERFCHLETADSPTYPSKLISKQGVFLDTARRGVTNPGSQLASLASPCVRLIQCCQHYHHHH